MPVGLWLILIVRVLIDKGRCWIAGCWIQNAIRNVMYVIVS